MPLIAKGSEKQFELVEAGMHKAICVWVIDRGMQTNEHFGKTQRKVSIHFELVDTHMSDGRPFMASSVYTLSLNEKSNLTKDLVSWRGRAFTEQELQGFDLQRILGVGCYINIIHTNHNDKTYANIAGIMPLKSEKPTPQNPIIFYDTEEHNEASWNLIPEGIQKHINKIEVEYVSQDTGFDPSDDIQF